MVLITTPRTDRRGTPTAGTPPAASWTGARPPPRRGEQCALVLERDFAHAGRAAGAIHDRRRDGHLHLPAAPDPLLDRQLGGGGVRVAPRLVRRRRHRLVLREGLLDEHRAAIVEVADRVARL